MFGYPTPKREHYRIPTAEDTASKLAGKSVFSILGEKDGFWHPSFWGKRVPFVTSTPLLDDLFLRCPVGISSVLEVFQKRNDQLFGDIAVVYVVFDDVIIGEKDDTEHDSIQFRILLVRVMLSLLSSSS